MKQPNQLTIQTSTNANINSLCNKKSVPYTTRNKSNEYNANTNNHNNNINNNNNKASNKKTQNTNMNLKNKFKLSTNPPLHLKTMSSNFQSSINTYNKIIKQTTTSNNNNNNNNNTLSSPKMKKSLNKVSFNSNKHIPTSPGSNARTNTHNNNRELFSPSNMNLDSIMKLTLKLYHSKDNAPVSKIHHARCNSSTNNRDTISTPTINNFNININNHICFNNNHSNNSNNDTTGIKPAKANNGKVNIQNLLDINKNSNILSRNNGEGVKKDTVLARTNTENNGNKKGYIITMNSPTNGQGVIIRSHNRRLSNGLVYEKKKTSRFLTQRGGSNGNKLVFGYGKSEFGFLKK